MTAANPPVSGARLRIYAAQIGIAPPSFVFFTNVATTFHFSYELFLINRIRERFGFIGSPIRVQVRRRGKKTDRGGKRRTVESGARAQNSERGKKSDRGKKSAGGKRSDGGKKSGRGQKSGRGARKPR